ncbi:MAG: hypothetical protein GY861_22730 [bacterium]|nr:hypothetical protein [bacterium]
MSKLKTKWIEDQAITFEKISSGAVGVGSSQIAIGDHTHQGLELENGSYFGNGDNNREIYPADPTLTLLLAFVRKDGNDIYNVATIQTSSNTIIVTKSHNKKSTLYHYNIFGL